MNSLVVVESMWGNVRWPRNLWRSGAVAHLFAT